MLTHCRADKIEGVLKVGRELLPTTLLGKNLIVRKFKELVLCPINITPEVLNIRQTDFK